MSQHLLWQDAMWLLLAVSLFGVALVSYLLPNAVSAAKRERLPKQWRFWRGGSEDLRGFVHHLKDSQMRLAYLIGGLAFMMMVNQYSFIQLHLMAPPYDWSRFEATLIFLCYSSGTLASYYTARWIARHGQLPLFRISLLLMLCGSLLTLLDTQVWICVGFLLTSCGFFITHSCCNSFVAMRASSHRAKATSLYLCCYYLGAAMGGPFFDAVLAARRVAGRGDGIHGFAVFDFAGGLAPRLAAKTAAQPGDGYASGGIVEVIFTLKTIFAHLVVEGLAR